VNHHALSCNKHIEMNDDDLIAAIAGGNDSALRTLFERHAPWVAARLRRVLAADAVEDVVQETFVAVWRGAPAYEARGEVGAWIWGIARRQAALWARKHARPAPAWSPGPTVDPEAAASDATDLQQAWAALEPSDRELARLVFVEERAVAEVASRLEIPPGTVKSRTYRIRRRLQAALRGER
jgi:RNA polymerase sigma-70 factor, ECF subfamily